MKLVFTTSNTFSQILYLCSVPLLIICWFDQTFNMMWLDDKIRIQLFIVSIIIISIAAILNLSTFIIKTYQKPDDLQHQNHDQDNH